MKTEYIAKADIENAKVPYDELLTDYQRGWNDAIDSVKRCPPAFVRPATFGRWVKQSVSFDLCGIEYFKCDQCNREEQLQYPFCPWCGAKMSREAGETK